MNYSRLLNCLQLQIGSSKPGIVSYEATSRGGYGVCLVNDKKYFFKYKNSSNFSGEYDLAKNNTLSFPSPDIAFYKYPISVSEDMMVWDYMDNIYTGKSFLHNFVYNPTIPIKERLETYSNLWTDYWIRLNSSSILIKEKIQFTNYPLFEYRMFHGRFVEFYGTKFEKLYQDWKVLYPDSDIRPIVDMLNLAIDSFKEQTSFLTVISHGDPHDFNLCISPLIFFDLEYAGQNSLASEMACYLWYIYAQSGIGLEKYFKRFFDKTRLYDNNVIIQQQLKRIFWDNFISKAIKLYNRHSLSFENELLARLFARILGIRNILLYDWEDRKRIYSIIEMLLLAHKKGNLITELEAIMVEQDFTQLTF